MLEHAPGSTDQAAAYLPVAAALALAPAGPAEAALRAMADYVARDLTREHPDLGRGGAVCPYAAGAVRRDLVRLAASPLDRVDATAMRSAVAELRCVFEDLAAAAAPRDRVYAAALLVFPSLPAGGSALIDRIQREAKPAIVRDGLMIGEFYPGCPAPGLYGARFRPFDAPVPTLAIRMMTAQDAPFLRDDPRFVAAFERRFGRPAPRAGG